MTSMSPSPNAKGMAFVAQLCEGKRLGGGGCWAVEPGQGLDDGVGEAGRFLHSNNQKILGVYRITPSSGTTGFFVFLLFPMIPSLMILSFNLFPFQFHLFDRLKPVFWARRLS